MREGYLLNELGEARREAQGCTFCWLEAVQASRYLEGVANDGVNDVPLRRKLAAQGGYCPAHAAEFARLASPLPTAILLGAFLEDRLARVQAGRRPQSVQCEACRVAIKTRESFAGSVGQHRRSAALGQVLKEADLCLPHLETLAPQLPAELRDEIVKQHDHLRHDLAEIIRKHDYRFREALSDGEKGSLKKVLELLGWK